MRQVVGALDNGLYLPALITTLTLPDICASLTHQRGKTDGDRYIRWAKKWLQYSPDAAARLWQFRCGLLHTGSLGQSQDALVARMMFVEPAAGVPEVHGPEATVFFEGHAYTPISLEAFVQEMIAAVERWLERYNADDLVQFNAARSVRRHPHGFAFIADAPVIA